MLVFINIDEHILKSVVNGCTIAIEYTATTKNLRLFRE